MGYSEMEVQRMAELAEQLNAIGQDVRPLRSGLKQQSFFGARIEYPRRDPLKTIIPFIEDEGIPCGGWYMECRDKRSERAGVWVGD